MVSDLGPGYIGRYNMFYICEMTRKFYFGHDGGLMLMKKRILMIAHILDYNIFGFQWSYYEAKWFDPCIL